MSRQGSATPLVKETVKLPGRWNQRIAVAPRNRTGFRSPASGAVLPTTKKKKQIQVIRGRGSLQMAFGIQRANWLSRGDVL